MADTVNLFGSQVKKGYVIAGGAVIVIAVGYGWWKNKQQAAQTGSSTPANTAAASTPAPSYAAGGDPYPPDGTTGNTADPNSTDPASGQTYGDEGQFASGYGALGYGSYDGYGGGAYYPPGVTGSQVTYTSNAQWAQAAEQYLTGTPGANANTVAAALGKYLTGQPVTSDQAAVIDQAIGFTGYPPVQGPDGYPPNIQTAAAGSPPPSGGSGTAPSSAPGGLAVSPNPGGFTARWSGVNGASGYELVIVGAGGKGTGTSSYDRTTSATSATGEATLAPGRYLARVRAGNSAGTGPWSGNTTFTVSGSK